MIKRTEYVVCLVLQFELSKLLLKSTSCHMDSNYQSWILNVIVPMYLRIYS